MNQAQSKPDALEQVHEGMPAEPGKLIVFDLHSLACMQCDLQFQMDLEVARNVGSQEIDAGVIRVRLDPRIRLEREA